MIPFGGASPEQVGDQVEVGERGLGSGRFSGNALSLLFATVLVIAAFFMIRPFKASSDDGERGGSAFRWRRTIGGRVYSVNLALALPISFLAGTISGLVGVGGGLLKVPMMVLLFGVPMDIAVGSSALMVGITASGGFAGHVIGGHWDWRTSIVLAVAVFIGGQIGSRFSVGLDQKKLKRGFGWFLLVVALAMIVRPLIVPS